MREFKQHKKDIEFELRRFGATILLSIRSIDADLYQTKYAVVTRYKCRKSSTLSSRSVYAFSIYL